MSTTRTNAISLTLEGLSSENGNVRLEEFINQLEALKVALDRVDREVTGANTVYYRVTCLSQNSPATIQIEPMLRERFAKGPNRARYRTAPKQIHDRFFSTLKAIRFRHATIPDVRVETLDSFRAMVDGLQTDFAAASLSNQSIKIPLDEGMREALDELERPSSKSYGSILGDLLTISFARSRRFYLYPPVGPSSVACLFSSGLEKKALENVKKRVRCYGTKYFRPSERLPFKMDVERIEQIVIPRRFTALGKQRPHRGEAADVVIARDRDEEWD